LWYARKPEDTSNLDNVHDTIRDEEMLESDEEDDGNHARESSDAVQPAPIPTATDASQASVEQLTSVAAKGNSL
jgi:hypothetical protein